MAIKPDFHILARDCGNGKLDWKNHIHTSEKAANEFRDKLDGKWKIFKLEPVEIIEESTEEVVKSDEYEIIYLQRNGSTTRTSVKASSIYQARHIARTVIDRMQGFGLEIKDIRKLVKQSF